jgi:hypothetical protein
MNKEPEYPNIDALKARLELSTEKLRTVIAGLDLPTPPQALHQQVIDAHLPPNLERLVLFLFVHNGTRSDKISPAIAISNISDTHTKTRTREQLKQLNLMIKCEILPAVNRYGALTKMGHLFIQPLPGNEHWQPRHSANDS